MVRWVMAAVGLGWGVAVAQVNVEPITSAATDPGFGLNAKAGVAFALGNVQYFDLTGAGTLTYVTDHPMAVEEEGNNAFRDRVVLNGNLRRKYANDAIVIDAQFVHARYTRMQWLRLGAEVFAQVGEDRFLLQETRFVAGGGLRFVLAETSRADVVGGLGYMYEWEDRDISEGFPDPEIERDHRLATYLTANLFPIEDRLTISNTVYFQPRIDQPSDLQLTNDLSLKLRVTEQVALDSSIYLRFDSEQPSEIKDLDVRSSSGISVSF